MTNSAKRTGIVHHRRYADHCVAPDHPECPERLAVLYAMLQDSGMQGYFQDITPQNAEKEDLHRVHSQKYVCRLCFPAPPLLGRWEIIVNHYYINRTRETK